MCGAGESATRVWVGATGACAVAAGVWCAAQSGGETGDRAWCSALRGRLAGGRVGVQEGECVTNHSNTGTSNPCTPYRV